LIQKKTNHFEEEITMTKDQILEAVKNMTVLELNDLVKAIEEVFG